jgi:hypothetical protein
MTKSLRYTFIVHAVVSLLTGAALLVAPGRSLGLLGWLPIDPLLSRVLGAALLGMAWSSWRGFRSTDWKQVRLLVEAEAVFCVLASVAVLYHIAGENFPWYAWTMFAVLAAFAVAWLVALYRALRAKA